MKQDIIKTIGIRIKENRERIGMTQSDLAEKTELSESYISHIERGKRTATIVSLVNIANVLGVTVDGLLYGVQINDNTEYQTDMDMVLDGCNTIEKRIIFKAALFAKYIISNYKKI